MQFRPITCYQIREKTQHSLQRDEPVGEKKTSNTFPPRFHRRERCGESSGVGRRLCDWLPCGSEFINSRMWSNLPASYVFLLVLAVLLLYANFFSTSVFHTLAQLKGNNLEGYFFLTRVPTVV